MKILLDTHIFLWYMWGDKSLTKEIKQLIDNPQNVKLLSMASLWEIAIKNSIGKLALIGKMKTFAVLATLTKNFSFNYRL